MTARIKRVKSILLAISAIVCMCIGVCSGAYAVILLSTTPSAVLQIIVLIGICWFATYDGIDISIRAIDCWKETMPVNWL